jgi:hypothetical protein
MTLLAGILLIAISVVMFFRSLPRDGKVARFVGTAWEPYVVVIIILTFGVGLLWATAGVIELNESRGR